MIDHKKHYLTTAEYSVLTGSKRFTNGNNKKNRRTKFGAPQVKPTRTDMVDSSPSDSKLAGLYKQFKLWNEIFQNAQK